MDSPSYGRSTKRGKGIQVIGVFYFITIIIKVYKVGGIEVSKLNKKQKAFADYYIESLNATESYVKAYECSYNTARTNGARLLANANIKRYIDEVMSAKDESRIASQDEILQILTDIARGVTEEEVVKFSQL